jgi:hypothetical protein
VGIQKGLSNVKVTDGFQRPTTETIGISWMITFDTFGNVPGLEMEHEMYPDDTMHELVLLYVVPLQIQQMEMDSEATSRSEKLTDKMGAATEIVLGDIVY